ncbi:hypothetical protein [Nostoc commune]|uniref:hypothetical protein n=1 Tax=Nostoc commune TaxID=1178 RepID=UPI0020731EF8|nr:hypothetical protein [Nostoc commune]
MIIRVAFRDIKKPYAFMQNCTKKLPHDSATLASRRASQAIVDIAHSSPILQIFLQ